MHGTTEALQRHARLLGFLNRFFAQDSRMGALPTLYAALAPDVKTGDYFGPSGYMEMKGYPVRVKSNALSQDKKVAAQLWDISENLTEVRYGFN